jgi:hypothetical protein
MALSKSVRLCNHTVRFIQASWRIVLSRDNVLFVVIPMHGVINVTVAVDSCTNPLLNLNVSVLTYRRDPFEPESTTSIEAPVENEDTDTKGTGWLINPRCKLDGAKPEKRSTKHLFLRLDSLTDKTVAWFKGSSEGWTANAVAITQSWIDKGLHPRAITRDLKWGVPIPEVEGLDSKEYSSKVFYVWFDACIGYPSITKNYTDRDNLDGNDWEQWWKNPKEVELYHFLGKDNVPFHSIVGSYPSKDRFNSLLTVS